MASSIGLTVGIGGDFADLKAAFNGAVRASNEAAQDINRAMSGASANISASFRNLGGSVKNSMGSITPQQLGQSANQAASAFGRMGVAATVGFAAGGVALKGFLHAASDAQETANLVDVSFGEQASSVREWSSSFAGASNRSATAMLKAAGSVQGMLAPMLGVNKTTAAMSTNFAGLSTDLASFYNTSEPEALRALQGALAGNAEGMRRFGVTMTAGALEEYALAQNVGKTYAAMSEAEKVQLRYMYVMSKTGLAQGDAAKTSTSYANTVRGLEAAWDTAATQLGTAMLPAMSQLLGYVQQAISAFSALSPTTQNYIAAGMIAGVTTLGVASALGILFRGAQTIGAAFSGAAAIFQFFGQTLIFVSASLANVAGAIGSVALAMGRSLLAAILPVLPTILAVAAALAVIVLAVQGVRAAWDSNLGGMQIKLRAFGDMLVDVFQASFKWVMTQWDKVTSYIGEKFIVATAMMRGQTPDEAHAQVAEFNKNGMGLLDISDAAESAKKEILHAWDYAKAVGGEISTKTQDAFAAGKSKLTEAWDKGRELFDGFVKNLKDALPKPADAKTPPAPAATQMQFQPGAKEAGDKSPVHTPPPKKGDDPLAELLNMNLPPLELSSRQAFELQPMAQQFGQAAAQTAGQLPSRMGTAGNVFNAASAGMATGGPVMAGVAAIGAVVAESQGFQKIAATLSTILSNFAQALNPIMDALKPFVDMISVLLNAVGKVIGVLAIALAPVFEALAEILQPIVEIVSAVLSALQPVLAIVGILARLMFALSPALKIFSAAAGLLARGINYVAKGIAWVANGIIEGIASLIDLLGGWLPIVGDDISKFADSIRASKIDMKQFDESYQDKAGALEKGPDETNKAVDKINEALTNVPQGFKANLARFNAAVGEASVPKSLAAAAAGNGSTIGGAAATGARNTTTNIYVQALDATGFYEAVKRATELDNLRKLGTTAIASGVAARS